MDHSYVYLLNSNTVGRDESPETGPPPSSVLAQIRMQTIKEILRSYKYNMAFTLQTRYSVVDSSNTRRISTNNTTFSKPDNHLATTTRLIFLYF